MVKKIKEWLYAIKADKLLHFIFGLVIAQVVAQIATLFLPKLVSLLCGLVVACIAAIRKELWDRNHNGVPSFADFAATMAGAAIGLAIIEI